MPHQLRFNARHAEITIFQVEQWRGEWKTQRIFRFSRRQLNRFTAR